ncbi:PREDICTED: pentatricopeptide repeat-containing protein At1g14470-like [Camelina sativa]|uniref:Pentatricopeptide repeat-containing protein At1g14470-like n=1 Tax=Camelina sativa TaxID=90675 RepID=A0ABM0Y626_CAMSA|nr:PREDICTED: pentatricopeptide repeat-containing protein At1g14470-like [Camelina sativa]
MSRELTVSLAAIASQALTFTQLNQIHAQLVVFNSLHRQSYWASRLINCCTRLRAPPCYTRLVFNSVAFPNVFVVTSMYRYFSHMDMANDALRLYEQRSRRGMMPDAWSFPVVIKSAGKFAVLFQAVVEKLGFFKDPYVRNVIMDMHVKHKSVESARKVFDQITQRTGSDWNVMISGYWKCGNKKEACKLFNMMPENEIDVVSWTVMITGFAKLKDLENARRYFDMMPEKSVVSWNAMLSGYAQNGFTEETIRLFDEMLRLGVGVKPNETTWVIVISACSIRGDPSLAHSLVKLIDEQRVRLNCFVKTALLDMHAKCRDILSARRIFNEFGTQKNLVTWNAMISGYTRIGDLSSARELFDTMPERNVVSWNSMIAGYAHNGQPALAIEFFEEMIDYGDSKPDEVTMISVLSACGHLGDLELGNCIVDYIGKNQIKLNVSGYRALIFMYARCGNLWEAKRVFDEMKERDLVSYNTVFSAFAANGDGVETLNLFSKMKGEGIEPDHTTYSSVLTACNRAGLHEEGQKIFESITNPSMDHYACMDDLLG